MGEGAESNLNLFGAQRTVYLKRPDAGPSFALDGCGFKVDCGSSILFSAAATKPRAKCELPKIGQIKGRALELSTFDVPSCLFDETACDESETAVHMSAVAGLHVSNRKSYLQTDFFFFFRQKTQNRSTKFSNLQHPIFFFFAVYF